MKKLTFITVAICVLAIVYAFAGCSSDPSFSSDRIGIHHSHPDGSQCRYVGRVNDRNVFTYCMEVE